MTPEQVRTSILALCAKHADDHRLWAAEAAGWPNAEPPCPEAAALDRLAAAIRTMHLPSLWQQESAMPSACNKLTYMRVFPRTQFVLKHLMGGQTLWTPLPPLPAERRAMPWVPD